jgi:3-oxoacyl-[acyl-carrier protein] reductase
MQLFEPGTVAAVTGGSRGIGAAAVRTLADEGVEVFFSYRSGEAAAKALEETVAAAGGKAHALRLDVSDEDQVRSFFRGIKAVSGRLDVFVSNAGTGQDGLIATMPTRQFKAALEVNAVGTFLCCREALRLMVAQRSGAMVIVSSVTALIGRQGQASYSAAKGAVTSLARGLAVEGCRYGVRVNSVSPGFVATDMSSTIPEDIVEQDVLIGRMATPDEIANAIVMAASDRLSYLVGANLIVDGGATMSPPNRPRSLSPRRAGAERNRLAAATGTEGN